MGLEEIIKPIYRVTLIITSQKTCLAVATIDDLISTGIPTHSIHVWYIYLHFPHKSTKCSKYTIHGWSGKGHILRKTLKQDAYPQPSRILSHQESKSIVQIQPETFQILSMKSYCILGTVAGFLLTFSPIW